LQVLNVRKKKKIVSILEKITKSFKDGNFFPRSLSSAYQVQASSPIADTGSKRRGFRYLCGEGHNVHGRSGGSLVNVKGTLNSGLGGMLVI